METATIYIPAQLRVAPQEKFLHSKKKQKKKNNNNCIASS